MAKLSSLSFFCHLLAAIAIVIATQGVNAQETDQLKAAPGDVATIEQWIDDLASGSFKTRLDATKQLTTAADSAIAPLRKAIQKAKGEAKLRMESILKELERNSFAGRLAALSKFPTARNAAKLPEWRRFAKVIGEDQESIEFYVRLLKAEEKLFATATRFPKQVSEILETRAAELMQTTRPKTFSEIAAPFTVDSYAALLFLAGNESTRLVRGTSTDLSALLHHNLFLEAIKGKDQDRLLALTGEYILRDRIGVVAPLLFARNNPLPQGLVLARRVLKSALRANNGMQAMMLLSEQGSEKDLPLLESVFNNRGVLFRNNQPQRLQLRGRDFTVYNGDLALAVAITLRGEDPRNFGFPVDENDDRGGKFRFSYDATGFESNVDREAAHQKYADQFLSAVR